MKSKTIFHTILFGVLLLAAGWYVLLHFRNRLVVRNESGQPVRLLTVTIGGETIRFENLLPGDVVTASFWIRSDNHFAVRGRLEDGTEIADDRGYVTNGTYGVRACLSILPGGEIGLTQRPVLD